MPGHLLWTLTCSNFAQSWRRLVNCNVLQAFVCTSQSSCQPAHTCCLRISVLPLLLSRCASPAPIMTIFKSGHAAIFDCTFCCVLDVRDAFQAVFRPPHSLRRKKIADSEIGLSICSPLSARVKLPNLVSVLWIPCIAGQLRDTPGLILRKGQIHF